MADDGDVAMDAEWAGAGAGAGAGGAGAGGGVDADGDSAMPAEEYVLSSLLSYEDQPYRSVCVTSDGAIVTGGGDSLVKVWQYDEEKNKYSVALTLTGPSTSAWIRCLLAGPSGTFLAGADDGVIRAYSATGELVRELQGHSGRVQSLSWASFGRVLVSGAWDGEARVWNVDTKECIAVLGQHENIVSVAVLPNGNLVTGSTGHQKAAGALPTEFRLRIWREGTMIKMLEDHRDAVKDLCTVPGMGFASASNDGFLKLRDLSGSVITEFETPIRFDGFHNGIFKVKCLPGNVLATCQEDMHVRLYTPSSLLQEIMLPGDVWDVADLPNGDLVTVGSLKGRGGIGIVWTRDAERHASKADKSQYEAYIAAVIESARPAAASGGGGAGGGGGLPPGFSILGPHSEKDAFPGTKDNQRGFFQTDDGQVMLSMWSAATNKWVDLGYYSGAAGAGGGGGGGASMGVAGREGELRDKYDYVERIDLDMDGGMKVTYLYFNATDNPENVVKTYMKEYKVPMREEFVEQIRNKVYSEWRRVKEKYDKANKKKSYRHFPNFGYLPFKKAKTLPKALEKLQAMGAADESKEASLITSAHLERMEAIVKTLSATSFYHSSKFTEKQVRTLRILLGVDDAQVFPVLDILRVAMTHPDGAAQAARSGLDAAVISRVLEILRTDAPPLPVLVLGLRCINNMFVNDATRATVFQQSSLIIDGVASCLALAKTKRPVLLTMSTLLLNFAKMLYHKRDAGPSFAALTQQVIDTVYALLPAAAGRPVFDCIVALGHLAMITDTATAAVKAGAAPLGGSNVTHAPDTDVVAALADLRQLAGL